MCGPFAPVLLAASTVLAAGGQIYSGLQANAQGKYEYRVAQQNREVELHARDDARARGEIEQMRHWRRVSQAAGAQRAQQAASGVEVGFGSSADLQDDIMLIGYEDSAIIGENTVREMRGYEVNAANYLNQGRAARGRGRAALIGSGISAFSTILGGASQYKTQVAQRRAASFGGN